MKTVTKAILIPLLLGVFVAFCMNGCASTPTKLEQKLFDIQTNTVQVVVTNTVTRTNYEVQRIQQIVPTPSGSVTNFIEITNAVPVQFQVPATNYTEHYTYTPNQNAAAIKQTGTEIGGFFGVGGTVGTIITGIFGAWAAFAEWRSKKNKNTAEALSQIIETGSEVLKLAPNGAQWDAAWKQWMQKHQAETGTLSNVMKILQNVTDNQTAQNAAAEIQEIIGAVNAKAMPTPANPPVPNMPA